MLRKGSEEDGKVRHVRNKMTLTVKMETVTLISRYTESAYLVYEVYDINGNIFFLSTNLIFGGSS
jgi:hypothetical protein